MHGGMSQGAPTGNRNALRHGRYGRDTIEMRRILAGLIRQGRKWLWNEVAARVAGELRPASS